MSVVIETTIGDITVDLYLKERPNTCLNFLKLCKMKYYNLCLFYKVERNFIAQSGDPTATGRGGESVFARLYGDQAKYFDSELKPRLKHEKMGTLSMVNNGNNMNGSQFFLTLRENLTYLDEVHTVFGEVAEGFDILLKLNETICDPNNRPYQDIRITHTVVLHDPFDDPSGLEIPDASPEPTKEMLETDYIAPDEEIDDTKGKNIEEIEEKIKESEAKARATILEMVGDLPDADVKPPEDVLFVCKLNPVTESKDLKVIFSRFGPIKSCEVIRDKKTGESLQYAFIEFENEEDCENAYFKMDNVLIDDRRIHVDFSQSVSKMNWNQKDKLLKGKSDKRKNFIIKNTNKTDGYEMIFDTPRDEQKRNKVDDKSKHSYKKNSNHSSKKPEYHNKRLSISPDKYFYKNKKSNLYEKQHKTKDSRSSAMQSSPRNRNNRSRSPTIQSSPRNRKNRSRSPTIQSSSRSRKNRSRSPIKREYSDSKTSNYRKKKPRHDSSSTNSSVSPNREKTDIQYHKSYSKDRYSEKSRSSYYYEDPYSSSKNNLHSYDKSRDPKHSLKSSSRHHIRNSSSSDSRSLSPEIHLKNKSSSNPSKSYKNYDNEFRSKYSSKHNESRSKYSSKYKSQSKSPQRSHKNKLSHSSNKKYQSSDSTDSESETYISKSKSHKFISSSSHHSKQSRKVSHHKRSPS